MRSPLLDVARSAFFSLSDRWDLGGDMRMPDGFLFVAAGVDRVYAIKIELWTKDCLTDLARQDASTARRRGTALARDWQTQGWKETGYEEYGKSGVFGFTWAVDRARKEEIDDPKAEVVEMR